ncbi:hypothetical protein BDK51DRAFT_46084 [Blyttiomyces helicus]|uniref:Uncharacterized protein n=1 Tax=Blyttiomyces helicus TaxID=388810 RepID=A0A4P9WIS1_9FUNG|nr:hypothetical protein BDK51DRAFT_46084 [Blyttiomyces helicus]|eukprot:RKO91030.1 hypothetical protein BDK51DRAFT_46084 [Blyttiomyces helicus]
MLKQAVLALRPLNSISTFSRKGADSQLPSNWTVNLVHIYDTRTRNWTLGGTGIDLRSASLLPPTSSSLSPSSSPTPGMPVPVGGTPPSPSGASASGSSSTNWGAIGGGIGGSLVAILVAFGVALAIRKRRTSEKSRRYTAASASAGEMMLPPGQNVEDVDLEAVRPKVDKGKGRATEPEEPERGQAPDFAELVAADPEVSPPLLERQAGGSSATLARGPERSLTLIERQAGGSSSSGPRPR